MRSTAQKVRDGIVSWIAESGRTGEFDFAVMENWALNEITVRGTRLHKDSSIELNMILTFPLHELEGGPREKGARIAKEFVDQLDAS